MGQNVDILLRAQDQASGVIGNVGKSFSKLPSAFSRAAGAMSVVSGAAGDMGGAIGGVASKVAGLATTMAMGGPLGVAIGGISAAVALATVAWEMHAAAIKDAEAQAEGITSVFRKQNEELNKQQERIADLKDKLTNLGKSQSEILAAKAMTAESGLNIVYAERNKLLERKTQLEQFSKSMTGDDVVTKKLAEELASVNEQLASIKNRVENQKRMIAQSKEEAALQEKLAELGGKTNKATSVSRAGQKSLNAELREEVALMAALDKAVETLKNKTKERQKNEAEMIDYESKYAADAAAQNVQNANTQRKWQEEDKQRAIDHNNEIQQQNEQLMTSIGMSIGNTWANAFEQMVSGSASANVAIRSFVISSAETAVMSYAASGAAAAAFSRAGIPIIGPILAVTASAMVFGLIKGYLAQIPKAATGGILGGGSPGIDSIGYGGALTQRGEGILRPDQTRLFVRLGDVLSRLESSGAMGGLGGGVVVQQHNKYIGPTTSSDTARAARDMSRMLRRAHARGF